ncbi:MAG: hypothetical protein PHE80_04340 [Candidatus Omnitrophica bacterium]|nr:hypothetical protein [Candidatus Omnitrophota bacterium]
MKHRKSALLLAAILLAAFHFAASIAQMSNKFDDEPAAGPFGGIRLHYLRVINFDFSHGVSAQDGTSHILDNFIKSAVSGTHGLLDFAHWYAYSGIYDILGIPVNEFWLLFAQAVVMFCGLTLMSYAVYRLYDDAAAAVIFLAISSQVYVQHSISFYIIPANTFYEGLLLLALYFYDWKGKGFAKKAPLLVMLFISSACGNVIKLPVYLYFAWAAAYKRDNYGPVRSVREYFVKNPSNLILAVPVIAAAVAHIYVYKRIGESNLGLLGWVSQKVGIGAPLVSKFAAVGSSLKSMLLSGVWQWWAFAALAAFYAIAVMRGKRLVLLLLFPVVYYMYLINLEPYSAMLPYVIIASIAVAQAFRMAGAKRVSVAAAAAFAAYIIWVPAAANISSLVSPMERKPNYLKSVGYYLREHMEKDDKIASLLDQKENILNEYYYGKNFFKSPVFGKYIYDMRNISEPPSPSNPVAEGETDMEFPFYVVSASCYKKDAGYALFVDNLVKKYSLKRSADIVSGGTVYASVYSSRPLVYESIEVKDANGRFDRKYANIKHLFYNRHVGVASTWGFY